jgi:hypothetical protein
MGKLSTKIKEKFDWDVTALDPYTNEQSTEFIQDLIASSVFLSKVRSLEGVKRRQAIKLLSADVKLQAMEGCTTNPDGSIIFTDRVLETARLYFGIEICNEDLNGHYTEMLNVLGSNNQDGEMPLEAVLLAYLNKQLAMKAQRVALNGDDTSLDAELALFDGFIKLLESDPAVIGVPFGANAFETAKNVVNAIDEDVFDNEVEHEVICSRATAQAILDHIYNDKDFNALTVDVTRANGQLSFVLPTTATRITSINTLKGNTNMYAVCYPYMFVGTDLESDIDGIEVKYDDYQNKLKAEVSFRLGVQFVYPQYFVRTDSTLS